MCRPTKWSKKLEEQAKEYIENFRDYGDEIPSHVGICGAIGVGKATIYRWAEEGRGRFRDILDYCMEKQEQQLINKGLNGDFNSNIVKLALGKHGYHEKVDQTKSGPGGGPIQLNVRAVELTDDELADIVEG